MRAEIRKTATILLVIMLLALASPAGMLGQQRFSDCNIKTENYFGKPVTTDLLLYEADKDYAIEIEFGDRCNIQKITGAPKYTWRYKIPQWTQPSYTVSLTENQYDEFLSKLNKLQVLGSLVNKGNDSVNVVTNSKTQHWDYYEHAFVRRTVHCCPSDNSELIFSFTIFFLHSVEGEITDIKPLQLASNIQIARIKIDDDWYLISVKESEKAKVGERSLLNVAGPVN